MMIWVEVDWFICKLVEVLKIFGCDVVSFFLKIFEFCGVMYLRNCWMIFFLKVVLLVRG